MLSHQVIAAHPAPLVNDEVLSECINACYDSVHACMSCADACLAEDDIAELRRCIQTDWNCADICNVTGRLLARQTQANRGLLQTQVQCCRQACEACAQECEEHSDQHRHCSLCAQTCRHCDETCRELLKAL